MPTPTTVKAPVYFVRVCVSEAIQQIRRHDDAEALTRVEAAIREADIAIDRVGDAFNPASLVLTTARHGAEAARRALMSRSADEALGALRATLAALSNMPVFIEAHAPENERGRA